MAAIMLKSRSRSLRNALLRMTTKSKSETIVILRRLHFADEESRLGAAFVGVAFSGTGRG
jgi:hypothetical protein